MIDAEKVIFRAAVILQGRGQTPGLSQQAIAVTEAIVEAVNQNGAPMRPASPRMKRPTLEAVKLQGAKSGLPEAECVRFFDYYESKGWIVGRSPMKLWTSALANWKRGVDECRGSGTLSGAQTMVFSKELERILARLGTLRSQYDAHQSWDEKDKAEARKLKARRDELKSRLGVVI